MEKLISELKYKFEQDENTIKLYESGVRFRTINYRITVEMFIPYNEILPKKLVILKEDRYYKLTIVLLLVNFVVSYLDIQVISGSIDNVYVSVFCTITTILSYIGFIFSLMYVRRLHLYIPSFLLNGARKYFIIEVDSDTIAHFENFTNQLYDLRRSYIRNVFFNIDSENEIELEKDKFQSMLDEEIISQSEYDLMMELLNEEDDDSEDEIDDTRCAV
jgi:hypothetical protein